MTTWKRAYALLTAAFLITAALNLLHVHAGFVTNYGADLVVPAWLYVAVRGLAGHRPRFPGRSPELAAVTIFAASTLTELCQRWWPHGVFRGHYDPFDIAAFGAGILLCYLPDRFSLRHSVATAMTLALLGCARTAPTPVAPAAGPDDPVAVVRAYYDAIDAGDYQAAYAMWGSTGPPHQTFEAFAKGFADTRSVKVTTATPSRVEGAAGSHYIEVPVSIEATTKSGRMQRFEGTYTLRRSAVDGAPAADRKWHLYRASVREILNTSK